MAYDEQSQIFGTECTARANSGLFDTTGGIMAYLQLGIDPKKLVLGLPWYGYDYNCTATGLPPQQKCYIARVPFRGVNCSDAAGRQLPYSQIYELSYKYGSYYDQHSATQFLFFTVTSNYVKIKRDFQN
jgi:di-N-acetylchitobiase